MTEQTKLTEPVQVGLWYETKAGAIVKIDKKTQVTGCFVSNIDSVHFYDGTCVTEDMHDLIRCLGADPFKQVQPVKIIYQPHPHMMMTDKGLVPVPDVNTSKTETTTLNARRCGKTQWLDDAVKNAGDDGFKVVNIPKPDYPTQFERIFTEVLGRNINLIGPYDPNAVSRDVSLAIVVTQEAIKQLKEIEGA